jgi:hypothetical protein
MTFFKDHPDLALAQLMPEQPASPESAFQNQANDPRHVHGRIGGLIKELARVSGIDSKTVLAVWLVESGGYPFMPGKPVLRFEVHKFWQHWGSQNATLFDRHFQFGGHNGIDGKSWQNHKWRRTVSDAWRKIHIGSQESEYEVFDFAARLGGLENACLSSSFGGPQILGSNHAVIDYPNATSLFEAFGESERWQVLGFFDFVRAKDLIGHLADKNWLAFAKVYNGEGNATVYAGRIQAAYDTLQSPVFQSSPAKETGGVFHVSTEKAQSLHLREGPKPAAIIAVLNQAQTVQKISEDERKREWWKVEANIGGNSVMGYVHGNFLAPNAAPAGPLPFTGLIPEARLKPNGATRTSYANRLHPLDEPNMPSRSGSDAETRSREILAILNFLDAPNIDHVRYQPDGGSVRSSAFIHDFCQLAGAHLPCVWWTENAMAAIRRGEAVPVHHGETVRELTINALHDWLLDHGASFGWRRLFDLDALQAAANDGKVCLIVAQCKDLDRSGHIVAIVPETPQLSATRKSGKVTQPIEAQAGQVNFTAKVQLIQWWRNPSRFRSFGFWRHG